MVIYCFHGDGDDDDSSDDDDDDNDVIVPIVQDILYNFISPSLDRPNSTPIAI